ncbi:hypothetical protein LP419_06000 [Massilia sp. H-1]|nr:hypothetical protein LP419_06000 [Massilia sp. H-1]
MVEAAYMTPWKRRFDAICVPIVQCSDSLTMPMHRITTALEAIAPNRMLEYGIKPSGNDGRSKIKPMVAASKIAQGIKNSIRLASSLDQV